MGKHPERVRILKVGLGAVLILAGVLILAALLQAALNRACEVVAEGRREEIDGGALSVVQIGGLVAARAGVLHDEGGEIEDSTGILRR